MTAEHAAQQNAATAESGEQQAQQARAAYETGQRLGAQEESARPTGPAGADDAAERVVVRDKRRVRADAEAAGKAAQPSAGAEATAEDPEVTGLRGRIDELVADLQRLKAEYDNYRRRVERDRQVATDHATAKVLLGLLPTLDDIGRARQHGDLAGPFKVVAESLEGTLDTLGLERYTNPGDPFDPQVHEALVHSYQPGLSGPTCVEVYRPGYRYKGRVLRPAQVVVAEPPAGDEPPPAADPSGLTGGGGSGGANGTT